MGLSKIGDCRWLLTLLCVGLAACGSERETWTLTLQVTPEVAGSALHKDADAPAEWENDPTHVKVIGPPVHLRPCCVLGMDLKPAIKGIPVPLVEISNIIDPDELGLHTYDAGYLGYGTDRQERKSEEVTGILYSCRGGFIDISHARDYADWTIFLSLWVYRHLGQAAEVELAPELGPRIIRLEPFDVSTLEHRERSLLSIYLAGWLAYRLSAWHEIAQWHGLGMELFPEYPSAYSPEDMYSNMMGIRLAAALAYYGQLHSDQLYSRSFDLWLKQSLAYLEAVPLESSRAYMRAVDQIWWDSNERVPNKFLVLKRNFDLGPVQQPLRLTRELLRDSSEPRERLTCRDDADPVVLEIPEQGLGYQLADLATLEIHIDKEHASAFSFPGATQREARRVDQSDFDAIARINAAQYADELAAHVGQRK